MPFVRAFLFNSLFFGVTTVLSLAYLPLMLLPWPVLNRAVRLWASIIMWLLRIVVGIRHEVRGSDNLPATPALVAVKHQSAWETISVNALLPDCAVVVKKELMQIPLWGWFEWLSGHIKVDRTGGAKALRAMCAAAAHALANGRHVVIFPQGTRTDPGVRRPYLPGVAALYERLDVPVVPVALNSGLYWGRRSFLKRPGLILLEYLEPIPPGLKRKQFMALLEQRIEAATTRLEEEAAGIVGRCGRSPGVVGGNRTSFPRPGNK